MENLLATGQPTFVSLGPRYVEIYPPPPPPGVYKVHDTRFGPKFTPSLNGVLSPVPITLQGVHNKRNENIKTDAKKVI